MELATELRSVTTDVLSKRQFATDEASTRSYLIDPFLRVLGYDPNNPNDVKPEFTAAFVAKNRKVDYALKKDGHPIILVESKPAKTNLSYEHTIQLQHYFSTKLNVHFGIVTNGLEYRFYTDIDNQNVMDDEPFLTVDIRDLDDGVIHELFSFSKSGFNFHKAVAKARELKYAAKIRNRIESEIEEPSRELIRYLARDLYSGSFTNSVADEFGPIIRQAFQQILSKDIGASPSPTSTHKQQALAAESPPIRDTFQPYVPSSAPQTDSNILEIPVFKRYRYKGQYHTFEATLMYNVKNWKLSKIKFRGKELNPSRSTLEAINTVNPKQKNPVNGWDFWKLRDPSSHEEQKIGVLRNDVALVRRMQGNT